MFYTNLKIFKIDQNRLFSYNFYLADNG